MKLIFILLAIASSNALAVHQATPFGKIVGIESRSWGMHIQTDFGIGDANNCAVEVGDTYMYDFRFDRSSFSGEDASDEIAMILAAYASQTKIAFHIYGCNDGGSRPVIGYIRLSN